MATLLLAQPLPFEGLPLASPKLISAQAKEASEIASCCCELCGFRRQNLRKTGRERLMRVKSTLANDNILQTFTNRSDGIIASRDMII